MEFQQKRRQFCLHKSLKKKGGSGELGFKKSDSDPPLGHRTKAFVAMLVLEHEQARHVKKKGRCHLQPEIFAAKWSSWTSGHWRAALQRKISSNVNALHCSVLHCTDCIVHIVGQPLRTLRTAVRRRRQPIVWVSYLQIDYERTAEDTYTSANSPALFCPDLFFFFFVLYCTDCFVHIVGQRLKPLRTAVRRRRQQISWFRVSRQMTAVNRTTHTCRSLQ